jgi:nitroreductase
MADNYLEKKFEKMRSGKKKKSTAKKTHISIDSLLLKNRSCRGYDSSYKVSDNELINIIEANTKIPSARNQQVLRFKIATKLNRQTSGDVDFITKNIKLAGALPELHLPFEGTEPNAYIVVYSTVSESKWVYIDLGISAQSMLLKAVDLGLNGICIGAFNKEAISERFKVAENLVPLMVIAIGKSIENFQLLPISEKENHNYFRENGVHFVPKVKLSDLMI